MSIELKIPEIGESIREVQLGAWLHEEGDVVDADEGLVELETDKASLELPAPGAGVLAKILKQEGETASIGEVVGYFDEGKPGRKSDSEKPGKSKKKKEPAGAAGNGAKDPRAKKRTEQESIATQGERAPAPGDRPEAPFATPSARRTLREHGLTLDDIDATGPRVRQEDVIKWLEEHGGARSAPAPSAPQRSDAAEEEALPTEQTAREELVPMSFLRRRIAERLVRAQQQAALLTTFNEIDMSAVKQLRSTHGERFRAKHGVKLGFMSFFVKAAVDALKQTPELNAEVRGEQIAYRNYYHVAVAIGSEKGLVAPVLRHAERLGFAEIERAIGDFATRADSGELEPDELSGGTFTISNGGVYGSLLSTPIVNPPQSGVLGMHAIEDRPVARGGQVAIRPMMYVALTYDHRIVDGREAVTFLRRVKEAIEEPALMLIEA